MLPERCTGCMRQQLAFSCTLAVVLLALLAAPALAGGWAVTTVDPLPSSLQAGQTYQVGFTIRQHGVSPFNQASPRVRAHLGDSYLSFGATRDGDGHYTARVEFPRDGAWTWVIDQTPFATQELGTLSVQPIVVVAPPVEVAPAPAVVPATEVAPPTFQLEGLLGYALAGALALVVLIWRRPLPRLIR